MDSQTQKEVVDVCFLIINNKIDFIEGCRKLVSFRNQFNLTEDSDFLPFVGVTSEIDDYPEPSIRENFSKDYLKRVDEDVAHYISIVRPSIIDACNVLITRYSAR